MKGRISTISSTHLIKMYKAMKTNPLKVWVATDYHFSTPTKIRLHFDTLVAMNLAEKVRTEWRNGKRHVYTTGTTAGYRLIQKKKD